jgi:PEP-CTERM motif
MKPTRHHPKAAALLAALSAAVWLAGPAHAGLLGNGSFDSLVFADGANCPGVALGKSCAEGVGASQQPDGSEVASLLFKAEPASGSGGAPEATSELTVAFVRDSFASTTGSQGALDAMGLACAADPGACRDKVYGVTAQGTGASAATAAGTGSPEAAAASSAFSLGFVQSLGGVQVSPQYGLSFLQAGSSGTARDAAPGTVPASAPERWEVTYGASNQQASATTSFEGSVGWSSGSSLQFQSTSSTQLQTYLANGPSGLMGKAQDGSVIGEPLGRGTRNGTVPEPSVLLLAGAALAALGLQRRRQCLRLPF